RECRRRRADRRGRVTPGLGVHGTEVLKLHDRGMMACAQDHWLFLHSLDSITTVRRLVAFYVEEHNRVLPHSALRGQTPDEMYFGTGDTVPADLTARATAARHSAWRRTDRRHAAHAHQPRRHNRQEPTSASRAYASRVTAWDKQVA